MLGKQRGLYSASGAGTGWRERSREPAGGGCGPVGYEGTFSSLTVSVFAKQIILEPHGGETSGEPMCSLSLSGSRESRGED